MGACARNMLSDSADIKPAQCCIKLVFHLTYVQTWYALQYLRETPDRYNDCKITGKLAVQDEVALVLGRGPRIRD